MSLALSRVINLEDFADPRVREAIREVFADEAAASPAFPSGTEHRKQWEIAMAVLALRDGGVLRPNAEVLGIGAGSEATLFWLTNQVRRVWATDLYAAPGAWMETAPPTMLIDPGELWHGRWNRRRLVVQHMDACDLAYEDGTFDAIFSSGSVEHFGSLERINHAMDEAVRVLKPGGTASFSTELLIKGDPLAFEDTTVMFTPDLIARVLVGDRGWAPVTPIDYRISDATLGTLVDIETVKQRRLANDADAELHGRGVEGSYPHCVLQIGANVLTSVHLALRKPSRRRVPARGAAFAHRVLTERRSGAAMSSRNTRGAANRTVVGSPGIATLPRVPHRPSMIKRILKQAARPLTSPIDGRVADINRRVDHSRRSLEANEDRLQDRINSLASSLDMYARSSVEAASYVGSELRRIDDQLQGLARNTLEEYYRERLTLACDLPLDRVDDSLAMLINHASSHRGFAAQAGLWFNSPIVVRLGAGVAEPTVVNERIVEVPFAMAALARISPPARILDVGSAESTFPLSAASLGYRVTAVDPRPLPYSHPTLQGFASRLEDWEKPSEPFSAAFLISTIEHVGLAAYGETPSGNPEHGTGADRALLERVRELLSPDGFLVLTAPCGTRAIDELERTYDDESLASLLRGWKIIERRIAVRRSDLVWEVASEIESDRGVVMVVASPQPSE